jgi:hypothetical protein
MGTIGDAINTLQSNMRGVEGMRAAPADPPENFAAFPISVAYPGTGTLTIGDPAGMYKGVLNLMLEVHVTRKDLPFDYRKIVVLFERIAQKLADDPTLGSNGTLAGPITVTFQRLGWGEMDTIGWLFAVPFKVQN